jgi:4-aminobutyrate aminotransferase-like enzyme
MGDPIRVLQAREILREISEKKLIENVNITGKFLMEQLERLQVSTFEIQLK